MSINPESEPSRAQERSSCYAEGPNFSVTLPGSDWFLAHDYKVPLGIFFKQQKLTYSFAAMRKGPESDLQDTAGILKHDRIYYVAVPEGRISNNILEIGTPDLLWLLDYVSELSNSSASYPPFSWTEEVEAFNTSCVVIEHPDGFDPDVVRYKILSVCIHLSRLPAGYHKDKRPNLRQDTRTSSSGCTLRRAKGPSTTQIPPDSREGAYIQGNSRRVSYDDGCLLDSKLRRKRLAVRSCYGEL